ncbi:MAG: DnaD domain protein [Clostridiales Family XIII bacterium]|jgi:DnaD/phage-associated family protein|nr:DnaD domain protein [Clostridiales Family XIII bacterium]
MNFTVESHPNYYLDDTQVPNVFIAEYMPGAPGDYVKVYLYAYMCAARRDILSNETIARELGVSVEDVLAAWTYFEKRGLIRKYFSNRLDELHYDVTFTDIKRLVVEGPGKAGDGGEKLRSALEDAEVRKMFQDIESITGALFPSADIQRVKVLLDDGASPGLIVSAYKFCRERKKNTRGAYVAEVAKRWLDAGVKTPEDAESYLIDTDARMDTYKRVMKALGLQFAAITDAEKAVFDDWLDRMGFTPDEILAAAAKAAGKRNKYDYVKKILESDYEAMTSGGLGSPAGGSGKNPATKRNVYYEKTRAKAEAEANAHRSEVYGKFPEVESIDKEIRRLDIESFSATESRTDRGQKESKRISAEIKRKLAEKADIMSRAGYPQDYMDIHYNCAKCKDTGVRDDGGACDCYKA